MALCIAINELNINLDDYSEDLFKPIGGQRNDLAFIVLKEMKRVYESNLGVKVPLTVPTENTRKEHEFMIIMKKVYTEFGISADPYVYLRQVVSKQNI